MRVAYPVLLNTSIMDVVAILTVNFVFVNCKPLASAKDAASSVSFSCVSTPINACPARGLPINYSAEVPVDKLSAWRQ